MSYKSVRQVFLRTGQFANQQSRPTLFGQFFRRQFASIEETETSHKAPVENAFIKERQAVKAHAAATSGKTYIYYTAKRRTVLTSPDL